MTAINFSGLASGIDTNALITATSQATRQEREKPLTSKITELTNEDTGLESLSTKWTQLQSLLYGFSTISGGGVAKTSSSTNETYVSALASNAATQGTYSLTVDQLAQGGTFSFNTSLTSSSASVSAAGGSVSVVVGQGGDAKTLNVTVTAGMTASDFVSQFNSQAASNSNVATASLVQVSTNDYRIMIISNNTGLDKGYIAVTSTVAEMSNSVPPSTLDQAQNAIFDFNGLANIARASNSVSDLVPGVTFNLNAAGTATVTIGNDVSTTETKVQQFIDKYNEIVQFMNDNNQVTRDESAREVQNIFAALANTRTDDEALSTFKSAFSQITSSTGSKIKIFADLGITTQRDGTLAFNKTTFESAMASEPTSVNEILQSFADTTSVTSGTIDSFIRFNGTFDITENSNKTQIDRLNKQVTDIEKYITDQESQMRARFARLESLMSKLQSQQSSLTSALGGLKR